MSSFRYVAITPDGEKVEGRQKADSMESVRWQLMEQGLQITRLVEADPGLDPEGFSFQNWRSPRSIHIELTLRQIAVMLRSGLTLMAAIETINEQPPSGAVRRVYQSVRAELENGLSLAEALSKHQCFPPSVIAMISMGEESGNLDTVMTRAADTMQGRRKSITSTLTALFYPAFTFVFALGIAIYMMVAVVPPMKKALTALGRPLPPITQSLLDIADFFAKWGVAIGVSIALIVTTIVLIWLTPAGRLMFDRLLLMTPLIGRILRTGATALFGRSMSTLLGSGIAIVEGLRIIQDLHGNQYLVAVVESARRHIMEGGSLADSLNHPYSYTPMMLKMVSVGEASGNLEETLENIAEFHEDQLQTLIKQLSALMEPAIILFVGALVGYVYAAFFIGLSGAV
ncbi:MAG: type II secretion system F family protein [Verrucomicrobiota bacterium]